jgi:hypothetical protein
MSATTSGNGRWRFGFVGALVAVLTTMALACQAVSQAGGAPFEPRLGDFAS